MFLLNIARDTPKFLDIMDEEANDENGGKHAATERSERPMGSKKDRQVKQLTNAVSLAVAQLGIRNDGGNNNKLHSARDKNFKMGCSK